MTRPIIEVENLGKLYRLGEYGAKSVIEDFNRLFCRLTGRPVKQTPRLRPAEKIWALKNVSFGVTQGEIVGIIGGNGAGKSTLLKILSRITEPTEGQAVLRGKVSSLLEVGAAFHPYLSGRENVFINAALLGMPSSVTKKKLSDILSFAEIGDFADTPTKRYSTGMRVRLAFAIAAYLEPDILIVDEVLAVGDERFQRKCLGKMSDVAQHGRTILFVSHDLAAVQHLCTRVIAIRKGQIIADGKPSESIQKYLATIGDDKTASGQEPSSKNGPWISVTHISQGPGTVENLLMFGKEAHIAFSVHGLGAGGRVMLEIYHESGALVSRFSTHGCNFEALEPGASLTCVMDELLITPGRYRLAAGLFMQGVLLHHQENVASFEIRPGYLNGHRISSYRESGYVHFGHRWELERSKIQTETASPRTESYEKELK